MSATGNPASVGGLNPSRTHRRAPRPGTRIAHASCARIPAPQTSRQLTARCSFASITASRRSVFTRITRLQPGKGIPGMGHHGCTHVPISTSWRARPLAARPAHSKSAEAPRQPASLSHQLRKWIGAMETDPQCRTSPPRCPAQLQPKISALWTSSPMNVAILHPSSPIH